MSVGWVAGKPTLSGEEARGFEEGKGRSQGAGLRPASCSSHRPRFVKSTEAGSRADRWYLMSTDLVSFLPLRLPDPFPPLARDPQPFPGLLITLLEKEISEVALKQRKPPSGAHSLVTGWVTAPGF